MATITKTVTEKGYIDLGDYDEIEGQTLTLNDWIKLWEMKTGKRLNPGTMRKRRAMANLGELVPPRVYLLTKEEFEQVLKTPLPMCVNVVPGRVASPRRP